MCSYAFCMRSGEAGPPSAVVNRLLGQVRGNGTQIMLDPSGRGQQSQKSLKFKVLLTVWESHTRTVSFKKKVPRVTKKDQKHH